MILTKQDVPLATQDDSYPIFIPSVAVLITCAEPGGRADITPVVSWTVISRFPFTVGIGLCNGHYSENYFPRYARKVINATGEFVVNIPHAGLKKAVSLCGSVSAFDPSVDKFALSGLTPGPAKIVKAPLVMECPIHLECKVTSVVPVGSHDFFLADVVAIQADPFTGQLIEDDQMVLYLCRPAERPMTSVSHQLHWRTLPHLEAIEEEP